MMPGARDRGTLLRAATAMAALSVMVALSGCRTPWYKQTEQADVARTDIRVDTVPDGADVYFDGKHIGKSPLILPVEYDHVVELWARAGNPGADLREATGPVGTVLLAPVWIVASIPQRREEQRRNVYGGNVHELRARWTEDGSTDAVEQVTLTGEESISVTLRR